MYTCKLCLHLTSSSLAQVVWSYLYQCTIKERDRESLGEDGRVEGEEEIGQSERRRRDGDTSSAHLHVVHVHA